MTDSAAQPWWRATTVYQIYPRSFYDSNGDGIGDLQGIIQKLDYIRDLGFETIWISPFFQSPQQDFGYDISDYYAIAPEYGDMTDCDQLIREAHQRKMKIIFDLVMNHTSARHPWFIESASSRDNPKADWYIWKDGKGKQGIRQRSPNNWKSMTGGSGWHYHDRRKQFYWASFLPFQPDLNYHNAEVKQAMFDVVRFWLGKGVDGFRLDIFSAIYKDSLFRDNPFSLYILPADEQLGAYFQHFKYTLNRQESFAFSAELRAVADEFGNPERFLVGEVNGDVPVIKKFCLYDGKPGLQAVFMFRTVSQPFNAQSYRKMVEDFERDFPEPFMPTYVFGNHDRKRSMSRLGGDVAKAKLLALFQFTVRGIPFTYNGEELGMTNVRIPLKAAKDTLAQRYRWVPQHIADLWDESLNRDECRTPFQWTDAPNAGFCPQAVQPWLPVAGNYKTVNAEQEQNDSGSLLNFYKRVIHLRNQTPALQSGKLEIADKLCSKKVFAYYRTSGSKRFLVMLNISESRVKIPGLHGKLLLSTRLQNSVHHYLEPWEGRVLE